MEPTPATPALIQQDIIQEQLDSLLTRLKAAKKVLARDWETLSPRERSFASRVVKDLEAERQVLLDSMA